jgi:hypothetical protein
MIFRNFTLNSIWCFFGEFPEPDYHFAGGLPTWRIITVDTELNHDGFGAGCTWHLMGIYEFCSVLHPFELSLGMSAKSSPTEINSLRFYERKLFRNVLCCRRLPLYGDWMLLSSGVLTKINTGKRTGNLLSKALKSNDETTIADWVFVWFVDGRLRSQCSKPKSLQVYHKERVTAQILHSVGRMEITWWWVQWCEVVQ